MLKTIFLILSGTSLVIGTQAQEGSVYLKGGLNIANVSTTTDGRINSANALASFHVGIMGDVPLCKFLALQPGLLKNGCKATPEPVFLSTICSGIPSPGIPSVC